MGTLSRTTDGRGADGSGTVSDGRAAANRSLKGKSLKARAGLAATTASVRASVRANAEANFFLVIGAHQLALGGLRCCERAIVLSQGRPLPAVDRAEIAGCHERRNASSGAHELGYMGGRGTLVSSLSIPFCSRRPKRTHRRCPARPGYAHQRAIVDAIGDPEKAGAFLCGVAFFRARFDAGRSMLFVQL